MDYFAGVSKADAKAVYRRLAAKLHPDRGGSTAEFQEMKRQYEALVTGRSYTQPQAEPSPQPRRYGTRTNPRCVSEGTIRISPDDFLRGYVICRDTEGERWRFGTDDIEEPMNFKMVRENGYEYVCVKVQTHFVVKEELQGEVTLEWKDRRSDVYIKILMADGTLFGYYKLHVSDRYDKHFSEDEDTIVRISVAPTVAFDHLRMQIRPKIKWTFDKPVVIYATMKRTKPGLFKRMDKALDKLVNKMKG